jgi:uncharacterized protein (TIGR04255 family)
MNEQTLPKNKITQFILRIDLPKDCTLDFRQLALDLKDDYVRFVENTEHNVHLDLDRHSVTERDFINYVLHADNGVQLILNTSQKTISFESNSYIDNSVYVDRLAAIIEKINNQGILGLMSSRIGMRFINLFPCEKKENIKKILQKPNDKAIIDSLAKVNLNRSVFVEQYNNGNYFVRVQYGIFNKFYPAVIRNLDVTLDIDVYYGGLRPIAEWTEDIRTYNHAAFDKFKEYVEPSYIETMQDE